MEDDKEEEEELILYILYVKGPNLVIIVPCLD